MQYIAYYYPNYNWDLMDGVIFKAGNIKNRSREIIDFHEKHPKLKIWLEAEVDVLDYIAPVIAASDKESFMLTLPDDNFADMLELITIGLDYDIPFCPKVTDYTQLHCANEYGASAITLLGDLCFALNNIKKLCPDVSLVCYPNLAQGVEEGDPRNFFIAPEDMELYEPYFDYCILMTRNNNTPKPFHEMYAIDKGWDGMLEVAVIGGPVYNRHLAADLTSANSRLNCNKRCMKGYNCDLCQQYEKLCLSLEMTNSQIKLVDND